MLTIIKCGDGYRYLQKSMFALAKYYCGNPCMIRGAARVLLVRVSMYFATEAAALQDAALC